MNSIHVSCKCSDTISKSRITGEGILSNTDTLIDWDRNVAQGLVKLNGHSMCQNNKILRKQWSENCHRGRWLHTITLFDISRERWKEGERRREEERWGGRQTFRIEVGVKSEIYLL